MPQSADHPTASRSQTPRHASRSELRQRLLAVVLPCFNVENQIAGVIQSLPHWVARIIAVDDHSTDGTLAILEGLAATDSRLTVVPRTSNGGVGAATVTGYRLAIESGADFIVKMDGDGQMDSADLPRLLLPLLEGRADYSKGNRFQHVCDLARMPRSRLIGNVALTLITKFVSGYWHVFDTQNGFTAISREALETLSLEQLDPSYAFENSVLSLLNIAGRSVADVPMPAIYGDECSSMRLTTVISRFPAKLLRMLLRRLFLKYVIYDVSPIAVYVILGLPLLAFGTSFGAYHWWQSIQSGVPATTGTVGLALLTFLVGYISVLQAVTLDIAQSPRLRARREQLDIREVCDRFTSSPS